MWRDLPEAIEKLIEVFNDRERREYGMLFDVTIGGHVSGGGTASEKPKTYRVEADSHAEAMMAVLLTSVFASVRYIRMTAEPVPDTHGKTIYAGERLRSFYGG